MFHQIRTSISATCCSGTGVLIRITNGKGLTTAFGYVNLHGSIYNDDAMTEFLTKVISHAPGSIRTVVYTIEGDPIITTFVYNANYYSVTIDTTRDKFGAGTIESFRYSNLVLYTDEDAERTYYIVTDLNEISKDIFDEGFDGVVLKFE